MIEFLLEAQKMIKQTARAIHSLKTANRALQTAERRLARQMNNIMSDVTNGVLEELNRLGHVPTSAIERGQIVDLFKRLGGRGLLEVLTNEVLTIAGLGRNQTISALQRSGQSLSFSDFDDRTLQLLQDHAFEASERTLDRLSGELMEHISEGYEEGKGIDEITRSIRGDFVDMQEHELQRIARTEIHSAQEEGKYLTEQEFGVEFHQWIAAADDRTREEVEGNEADGHLSMHGQIVRVGDKFSNGLAYAGDRSGGEATIGHWINCRCRTVPFIMPEGKRPPMNQTTFYENELVDAA